MLWLALHFPELPLELLARRVLRSQATDQQQPALIVLNAANRVLMCNQSAAQAGIGPGCTLATAHSIVPDVIHALQDPQAEQSRLEHLAEVLYQLSSHVSLQPPDSVLLEIGGSLKLFGDYQTLADKAVDLCRELGHGAAARVAATPWAAIALSRSGAQTLQAVPLTQSGMALAGVPDNIIERFDNMGIYTLGQLLELPLKHVGRRFGKALLTYLYRLQGLQADPRPARHPQQQFCEHLHFLQPVTDKETLCTSETGLGPANQLALALQHWLIAHQLGCAEIQWVFHASSEKHVSDDKTEAPHVKQLTLKFAEAKQNAADMLSVTRLKLEQAALPAEVLGLGLVALRLEPWQGGSHTLFGPSRQAGQAGSAKQGIDEHCLRLLDELNARLGDGLCQGIALADQHTPEHAWSQHAPGQRPSAGCEHIAPAHRPLWLFNEPQRLARSDLTLLQGPERLQSNWWQKSTARDYYIARHRSGCECWAFTDSAGNWYLHGYFS